MSESAQNSDSLVVVGFCFHRRKARYLGLYFEIFPILLILILLYSICFNLGLLRGTLLVELGLLLDFFGNFSTRDKRYHFRVKGNK